MSAAKRHCAPKSLVRDEKPHRMPQNKGFESVIQAMPRILSSHSNAVYMIAGATHPYVRAREGDRYRLELQALAKKLGVERQVLFINRFVTHEEIALLVARPTFTSRPTVTKRRLYREL
jgi:glycosyltransferase involved in cell wall biosynthesis